MTQHRPRQHGLSKSRITAFEQCPRRLWLAVHRPDLGEQDEGAQARFDIGHKVGEMACAIHPDGVMIEAAPNLAAALEQTEQLIAENHPGPLFEATFQHDGVLVRADILARDGAGGWSLAEVKSSTRAKDYHLGDIATQVWVMEQAGIALSGAAVRRIDTRFVLEREGDYAGLFVDDELLAPARKIAATRPAVVAQARAVLAGAEPLHEPGAHCDDPFPCEFAGHCTQGVPQGPEWPVTILPNGAWKKWARQGVTDLLALDEATMAKPREAMIVAATRSGQPFHDVAGARKAMAEWSFPRAWLDFETVSPAVPLWVGTRPYSQVPFQFSLHLEQADGTITHHEFLCCDGADPRPGCALALVEAIPEGATVIAYNAGFERGVLRALAEQMPQYRAALTAMAERTVDLLPVARAHWYHRDQRGSWSIKAVLPTVADLDYAGLEVKDGGMAQESFLEAVDPATTPDRRWALEEALKAYCMRDTWAMVALARRLAGEG